MWVISGLDGRILHELRRADDPNRSDQYGASIGGIDDYNLDGFDDFFVLDSQTYYAVPSRIHVHSGRDGSEIACGNRLGW